MNTQIILTKGDITTIEADAVVNDTNETLVGGGGVDAAINFAAGMGLYQELMTIGGCAKGEAKITPGYNLPTKYIIHTVGPKFGSENGKETEILTSCYYNSLRLAREHNLKTIALPCLCTGVFGYPKDQGARIAVGTVKKFIDENRDNQFDKILFVVYSEIDKMLYEQALKDRSIVYSIGA